MSLQVGLVILLAGCGGGPSDPGWEGWGVMRQVYDDPSFVTPIQDIFNGEGCTKGACRGVGASAGLNVEPGVSYASLVGSSSTQTGYERVAAGKADESLLIITLGGRQSVVARMPPTGPPLDQVDMGNLKNWINQGAKKH